MATKICSGYDEIAEEMSVSFVKAKELLEEGIVPSIYTGSEQRKRFYTTGALISHTMFMIADSLGVDETDPKKLFLRNKLSKNEVHKNSNYLNGKCQTVVVSNMKGGVGKTTTAVNIGTALAKLGQRVLIVDMDQQAQSSRYLRKMSFKNNSLLTILDKYKNEGKVTKEDVKARIFTVDNPLFDYSIDVLPSEIRLTRMIEVLRMNFRPETILDKILATVKDEYSFIIVDTPPAAGLALEMSLYAADKVVLATEADEFSTEGLEATVEEILYLNANSEKTVHVDAIFINSYSETLLQQKESVDDIITLLLSKIDLKDDMIYAVKYAPAIVRTSQSLQLPISEYTKKPKDALSVSEPFYDYAISLIQRNIKGDS